MKSYTQQLREIAPDISDESLAALIGKAMTESELTPYCFVINHNVGAPKYAACPVRYDFKFKTFVGILTSDKRIAEKWIADAIKLGYEVHRAGNGTTLAPARLHNPYDALSSLPRVRELAKRHQQPKELSDNDDDIPF